MEKIYLSGDKKEQLKRLQELGFRKKDAAATVRLLERRVPAEEKL